MDVNILIKELSSNQKDNNSIKKTLKELSKKDLSMLDSTNLNDILELKNMLDKLTLTVNNLKSSNKNLINEILDCKSIYEQKINDSLEKAKNKFATNLEEEFKKNNLKLSGSLSNLIVSMFTIELNFCKKRAIIWYGNKQEKITELPLKENEIVNSIVLKKQKFGCMLKADEFFNKLYVASLKARIINENSFMQKNNKKFEAPIINVLNEFIILIQNKKYLENPKKENYITYTRADFSYDLFRYLKLKTFEELNLRWRPSLIVAIRSSTKQRSDFLWIPDDDDSVKGTCYSHIKIEVLDNE